MAHLSAFGHSPCTPAGLEGMRLGAGPHSVPSSGAGTRPRQGSSETFLGSGRGRWGEGFSYSAEAGKQGWICVHSCGGSLCFSQDGLG